MKKLLAFLTAAAAGTALAACSTSGANPPAPSRVCNLSSNVLQMNVGTANLFGDVPASAVSGTNVAVTYRQSNSANCFVGNSGTAVNSPTLTIPGAALALAGTPGGFGSLSTIVSGAAPAEIGTHAMTSTPQTPNAANVTTFGVDGGAFGLGLEPFNTSTTSGTPDSLVPYPVPLYDALAGAGDPNAFEPGGGPPAFNISGNQAAVLAGFNAISEGLDVFAIAPAVGTYSLSVNVPANTGTVTASASAAISSVALLPAFTSPPVTAAMVSATGAVAIPVVLPAGVTEAYIQLVDYGPTVAGATSCGTSSAAAPTYNTVVLKASGTATFPAGTVCTAAQNGAVTANAGLGSDGDAFTVQAIGFDYGAYEASYPNSLGNSAPSLTGSGASKQADVTISSQGVYNQPAAGGLINGAGGAALPAKAKRIVYH